MDEDITFWKWVNDKTIGIVTAKSVYHWTLEDADSSTSTSPVKIFDRHMNLNDTQIINYRINSDEKWMVLIGIKAVVSIYIHI